MNQRLAILDLGTNTFHLLIVELKENHSFEVLYKAEEFVKLGENGLDKIGENPFQRGLEQIRKYKIIIDQYQPQQVIGFGTAAIRRAANGDDFIREIKAICPMEVRKISGDEEAELIYSGVRQAVHLTTEPVLIMDIGGGSTEFIIADSMQIRWKQSFPVGASVLKQKFHHHEPITASEINEVTIFLTAVLEPLIAQQEKFSITRLIGASGSFDTFAAMVAHQFFYATALDEKTSFEIPLENFYSIHRQLLQNNLQQRLEMEGMIPFRAEMITVATILAEFVIRKFNIQQITQSGFALKEGVLWNMIHHEPGFSS